MGKRVQRLLERKRELRERLGEIRGSIDRFTKEELPVPDYFTQKYADIMSELADIGREVKRKKKARKEYHN